MKQRHWHTFSSYKQVFWNLFIMISCYHKIYTTYGFFTPDYTTNSGRRVFCHNILLDSILNIVNRSLLSLKAYTMQRVHNCTIQCTSSVLLDICTLKILAVVRQNMAVLARLGCRRKVSLWTLFWFFDPCVILIYFIPS